jgi:hypothetical protein
MISSFNSIIIKVILLSLLINLNSIRAEQRFIEEPKDINVNLGETAILKCTVSQDHGDVQWVHDGTSLGYDRKVRGKPRYYVSWISNEQTEYHLRIDNVTLEDEGVFSCQAAPIVDWDTRLDAKARLTVLIPPNEPPHIMFNDQSMHPNEIVHYRSMSNAEAKFTCIMRKSRPAAQIKWFLDDKLVNWNVGKSKFTKKSGKYLLNKIQPIRCF